MRRRSALLLVALCMAVTFEGVGASQEEPAVAHATAPGDPIAAQLFPPELVMRYQKSIGVTDAQRRTITSTISALQSQVLEIQWDMQSEQQKLVELLAQSPVNAAAALAQADRLMDVERRIKRAHLGALIQIKNTLTHQQQTKLRALAGQDDAGN